MERFATPQQIARIVQMYASNQLPFEATQEFIRSHSSKKRRPKAAPVDIDLAFWEKRYPGKGEAIMGVLRPFYGWKPELKPALPDLKACAKKAIFWREVKGVRVFQLSDAASLGDSLGASLRDSLWCSLFFPCGFILADRPAQAARFKPLLDLWLAGNYPAGFDNDGYLLVLVA